MTAQVGFVQREVGFDLSCGPGRLILLPSRTMGMVEAKVQGRTGCFEGESILGGLFEFNKLSGKFGGREIGTFTGSIAGSAPGEGTMQIDFTALPPDVEGTWEIIGTSGGLECLTGKGTFSGEFGVGGTYDGKVQFDDIKENKLCDLFDHILKGISKKLCPK